MTCTPNPQLPFPQCAICLACVRRSPLFIMASSSKQNKKVQEDDLESTTAGGVPTMPSDDEGSDKDGMETSASDLSSRTSKWRGSASRSSGKKEKQRANMMAFLKKKAEESGTTFEPLSHEDFQQKQKSTRQDSATVEEVVTIQKADKIPLDERITHMMLTDAYFRPTFVPTPKTEASIRAVTMRYVVPKEQWQWCSLCSKWSNESHNSSDGHKARVAEMAAIDEMVGACSPTSLRRWTPNGLKEGLTQKSFVEYWGENIATMPQILWNRLSKGVKIEVEIMHEGFKKTTKKLLGLDDISSIAFAAVSYAGTGKYKCIGARIPERAVRWEDLEPSLEELMDEPQLERPTYGKFDCLIPDGEQKVADTDRSSKGVSLRDPIPASSSWWPACLLQWNGQHLDHGYPDQQGYFRMVCDGRLCVYALCWYQLMDGSWILVAWPIYLTSRL